MSLTMMMITIESIPVFSVSAAERKHLLFGRPQMLQPNQSYCILHQEGFVSAHSHNVRMPLWSSFTIDKPVRISRDENFQRCESINAQMNLTDKVLNTIHIRINFPLHSTLLIIKIPLY